MPALALLMLAIPVAALAVGVARPVTEALARRQAVRLPPVRRWVALVRDAPRRSVVAAVVVVVLVVTRWGTEPVAAGVALIAVGAAWLASLVDLRCHRLPDLIVLPMGLGLVLAAGAWSVLAGDGWWLGSALAAGVTAAVVLGVGWLVGMGLGDVKFGAALGVLTGWAVGTPVGAVLVALGGVGLASFGAAVWWLWSALVHRHAPRWFPFGPFLAASALVIGLLTGPPAGVTEAVGEAPWGTAVQQPGVPPGEPVRPG